MTNVDKTARTPTEYPHIEKDYKGRPVIAGTRMRVSMIVQDTYGVNRFTPEEIVDNHREMLTLTSVHEALAYYHKHKSEIDETMAAEEHFADELYERVKDPEFDARILAEAKTKGLVFE